LRVVYVMGSARSGSTILDIILGNHREIESVGELVNLPTRGREPNEYCACGDRVIDCGFWSAVREEWVGSIGRRRVEAYANAQRRFLRLRQWPLVVRQLHEPTAELESFIGDTEALYYSIATVSGRSVIVDPSKRPMLGLLLTACPAIDARLIHIVRDGRGVAWSLKKQVAANAESGVTRPLKPHSGLRAVKSWIVANHASELVCRRMDSDRYRLLRYEDLMRDPGGAVTELERLAGVDFTSLSERLREGQDLYVGHNVAGNRVRMGGSVTLRGVDAEWVDRLSLREKLLYRILAGAPLRKYGYEANPAHPMGEAS